MSEWEPGDMAMVTWYAHDKSVERAMWSGSGWLGGPTGIIPQSMVADARPLVVIDPEDMEQVQRLTGDIPLADQDDVQQALREFASPSPRVEPERYSVIEDADGIEWVKADEVGFCWQRLGQPSSEHNAYSPWMSLRHPVRILAPGYDPEATS